MCAPPLSMGGLARGCLDDVVVDGRERVSSTVRVQGRPQFSDVDGLPNTSLEPVGVLIQNFSLLQVRSVVGRQGVAHNFRGSAAGPTVFW